MFVGRVMSKIRRSGKSLVLTVPITVREAKDIIEGDAVIIDWESVQIRRKDAMGKAIQYNGSAVLGNDPTMDTISRNSGGPDGHIGTTEQTIKHTTEQTTEQTKEHTEEETWK